MKLLVIDKCRQCLFYHSWFGAGLEFKICRLVDEFLMTAEDIPYWCELPDRQLK